MIQIHIGGIVSEIGDSIVLVFRIDSNLIGLHGATLDVSNYIESEFEETVQLLQVAFSRELIARRLEIKSLNDIEPSRRMLAELNLIRLNKTLLRKLRKEMKLSQTELAEELGLSVSCISRWEQGFRLPNIQNRNRLLQMVIDYRASAEN